MRNKKNIPSVISNGLTVLGNIISEGSLEVEGRIEGNISCSAITVHKSGDIKGDILSERINISGNIEGKIQSDHVKLRKSARVKGVIEYKTISIEPGAFIDGQCKVVDGEFHQENNNSIEKEESKQLVKEEV